VRETRPDDKDTTSGLIASNPPLHQREVSSRDVGRRENSPPLAAAFADPRRGISVVPVAGCQEVIDDKISYVTAEPLTGHKVKEEMLPSKEAAQRCSSAAAGKLANERSTPGITSEVTLNSKWRLRKKEFSTSAPAALMTA